jgi:hypothetical protein
MLRTGERSEQGEYWLEVLGKEYNTNRTPLILDSEPKTRLQKLNDYLLTLPNLPSSENIQPIYSFIPDIWPIYSC